MSTSNIYCASCGASNDLADSVCFACGKWLIKSADDDNSAPLLGGTLLHNRYRLLNQVGEGGYATVYRAEDILSRRIVAIKSIGLASLSAQQMIEATDTYNREVLFGRALKHSHLPTFYDSFTDRDHWYLVVQFIDGETLDAYVQQRPSGHLALWEVLDIGIQLCDVLTHLHTRHPPVIFRDIKPDNIMRETSGEVYLIDFGIARHFRVGQRRDTHLLGSPGYAAPEQYGSAQTDERSDLYSLGATLQMLLTGRNPLDEQEEREGQEDAESFMDPEVAQLLERMQARKAEDRPANAQEVLDAFTDIAQRRGISRLIPALQKTQELHGDLVTASPSPLYAPLPPPTTPKRSSAGWITGGMISVIVILILNGVLHPLHPNAASQSIPVITSNQILTIGAIAEDSAINKEVLDSSLSPSLRDLQIEELLYSGLTTVNGQNQIVPGLAQSWDAQPDSTTDGLDWTFHLRPNLKFSDGSLLTSTDVAYTIDRVFSLPNTENGYFAQYFKDGNDRLKGKQKTLIGDSLLTPDPATLIIKSQGRGVFLPTLMSASCFLVMNKALIGKYGATFTDHLDEGGASGPFMLAAAISSDGLDLILNPFYYDQETYDQKAQIKKISVQFFSHIEGERTAYQSNAISMMVSPDYNYLTTEEQNDRQVLPVAGIDYLGMNYLTKPFNNIKIRQAFALALDKVTVMDDAYSAGALAINNIIPNGQPGYNTAFQGIAGVNTPHGDAALAQKLLQQGMQEEGMRGIGQLPPITFTYNSGNVVSVQDEMSSIQSQWSKVLGITVKMDDVPSDQLYNKINASVNNAHSLQLWFDGWQVDYPDPQNWTSLQFSKGSIRNVVNYGQNTSTDASAQQKVQADLLKADAMQDPQQRLKAYQDAEQQLVNDVAWLPISQHNSAELVKPNVHGYQINESGIVTPDVMEAMSIS